MTAQDISRHQQHLCWRGSPDTDPRIRQNPTPAAAAEAGAEADAAAQELLQGPFYAFPTLQQLATATEADLRALGFGYRSHAWLSCLLALSV